MTRLVTSSPPIVLQVTSYSFLMALPSFGVACRLIRLTNRRNWATGLETSPGKKNPQVVKLIKPVVVGDFWQILIRQVTFLNIKKSRFRGTTTLAKALFSCVVNLMLSS